MTLEQSAPINAEPGMAPTGGICRRHAIAGTVTACLAAPLLAACGSDDEASGDASGNGDGGSGASADGALTTTADVPVGGGVVLKDAEVVVVQPEADTFTGYTAICTHQGCVVSSVEDGLIKCGCHGSEFSIEDGSVQGGPATSALAEVALNVDGDQISLA